jgi:uncharacterized protein YqjF (DUF2071 family)
MSRLSSEALLAQTAHREQWALPTRPWVMAQTWEHLLFAHWPISVDALRSLIPPDLPIDTFDGQAWLGVVPFEMRNVHFRGVPPMPLLSAFPELNVRTYVTHNGKPGVWFFSLDAANFPAVQFARRVYHLPYFMATMHVQISGDTVTYRSARHTRPAEFRGRYRPVSEVYTSQPGTLESWLTERYYLYAADRRGRLYRGAIQHVPWPLQKAEAEIEQETTALSHGLRLPDIPPLLHYAHHIDVLAWSIEPI